MFSFVCVLRCLSSFIFVGSFLCFTVLLVVGVGVDVGGVGGVVVVLEMMWLVLVVVGGCCGRGVRCGVMSLYVGSCKKEMIFKNADGQTEDGERRTDG